MTRLFRLFVVLALVMGSVQMAPSRGQRIGSSQIVVCSAVGTETLTLDARGVPVGPQHACPDCVLCLALGPLPETDGFQLAVSSQPLSYPLPRHILSAEAGTVYPSARDPPVSA